MMNTTNLLILSTDTTITLEENMRTLPFNLMGEKGIVIDTLSSPP